MSEHRFPLLRVRVFMVFWRVLWWCATPFVLFYLWRRGQGDTLYHKHLGERFGFHKSRATAHVWVHAVSIGELRSAVPLIQSLLDDGEHVVTTHFTPAGRHAAQKDFAAYIATGQLSAVWVPFDYDAAFKRFFRAFQPKYGLVMEVEFWPGMIMTARSRESSVSNSPSQPITSLQAKRRPPLWRKTAQSLVLQALWQVKISYSQMR